ncbi:serine protease 46-like [Glossophaga mutica]
MVRPPSYLASAGYPSQHQARLEQSHRRSLCLWRRQRKQCRVSPCGWPWLRAGGRGLRPAVELPAGAGTVPAVLTTLKLSIAVAAAPLPSSAQTTSLPHVLAGTGSGVGQVPAVIVDSVRSMGSLRGGPQWSEPWFWGCGQTNVSCRVVNGKVVDVGKWPWQVSILFLGMYICSGSLVHHQWVLTAAHCLQSSMEPSQYSVMVGVQHLPENGTQLPLSHIVIHENFKNFMSNDIALLKLKDPIAWSPLVQPICLPSPRLRPSTGTMCWMIVWGRPSALVTKKAPYSLQEVAVRIINNNVCNERYQFLFLKDPKMSAGKDMLCASSEVGVDSCQSNSGSSLVCWKNKTWIQVGVESWSFSCKRHNFPDMYTSTSHFTQWIQSQITDVRFFSSACSTLPSLVFCTGYILLVSLGSLRLL